MSRARRTRASKRHIQPYAWLGAGAVTVGMGVALVGGTAVAFADNGNDAAGTTTTSAGPGASAGNDAPATKTGPRARGSRGPAAVSGASGDSVAGHRGRAATPVAPVDTTPDVTIDIAPQVTPEVAAETAPESTPVANSPLPAAAVATAPAPHRNRDSAPVANATVKADSAPVVDTAPEPVIADVAAPKVDAKPAASVGAAGVVNPTPVPPDQTWLPATPIVPGAKVKLALQQIEQAQALLSEETWGSGKILAGLGSFGPQAALASAQLMLAIWGSTIANAQAFVKNTADNPLIHWIAQANLQTELLWPKLSDISLATANALMTPLNWVGADVSGSQALTASARENGKVYAKVPIRVKLGTQPIVDAKINGGSKAALLLDTGASGLVTTRDKIGSAELGPVKGSGNSCFSGGACYHYETYDMTVDLGDGAVATTPVNIVTNNDQYPNSVTEFKNFFAWGADGILGVGANTVGPGPNPIPTAAMPGELSDGLLIYQNAYPFGLGGYMILGPNLFPTRVSVPGAPDAFTQVRINGQPATSSDPSGAIIDSGGVYGTIRRSDIPAGVTLEKIDGFDYLPAGTKIDVYTPDGATLLYTYTTIRGGTPVIDTGLYNTGNAPYAQGPIYLNYGTVPYTGQGSTDFSIA